MEVEGRKLVAQAAETVGVLEDRLVTAPRELHVLEAVIRTPEGSESLAHGSSAGSSAGNQGRVDVEDEEPAVCHRRCSGLFDRVACLDPGLGAAFDVVELFVAHRRGELTGQGAARAHLADEHELLVRLELGFRGDDGHVRNVDRAGYVPAVELAGRASVNHLHLARINFFFRLGYVDAGEGFAWVFGGHACVISLALPFQYNNGVNSRLITVR